MSVQFMARNVYIPGDLKFGAELNGVQMHVYFVSGANKWNVAAWLEKNRQPHPNGGRRREIKGVHKRSNHYAFLLKHIDSIWAHREFWAGGEA